MEVLKITNLTKDYGKLRALDNLNLTIESGNVYGLLGPNGSGKTTTLGIILGILSKTSGDFEWFDGTALPDVSGLVLRVDSTINNWKCTFINSAQSRIM